MPVRGRFEAVAISLLLIGVAIRYSQLGFVSDDIRYYFLPWYGEVTRRGFVSVGQNFYTYPSLLIFSYWVMSLFGGVISAVVLLKIPILICELGLAAGFARIVSSFSGEKDRSRIFGYAFAFVYLLPTVILNGAAWGQCDVVYALGVVWAVAFLIDPRGVQSLNAHLAFGAALLIKPQCIFIAPVFLVLYLRKLARPIHLLVIPVVYAIGMIPALLAGSAVLPLLLFHFKLVGMFRSLTMNTPNLYAWISNDYYDVAYPAGITLAASGLLFACFAFARRLKAIGPREILTMAAFFTWLAPNLLPKMHERYFYMAEILILAVALTTNGRRRWVPWLMTVLLQVVTLFSYAHYLYKTDLIPAPLWPLFHLALGALWFVYFHDLFASELKTFHPIDENSSLRLT